MISRHIITQIEHYLKKPNYTVLLKYNKLLTKEHEVLLGESTLINRLSELLEEKTGMVHYAQYCQEAIEQLNELVQQIHDDSVVEKQTDLFDSASKQDNSTFHLSNNEKNELIKQIQIHIQILEWFIMYYKELKHPTRMEFKD